MDINERFSPSVRELLAEAIGDARGNEVMAVGHLNHQKQVISLTIAARGDESSVPALEPFMENGDVVIHNHPSGRLQPSKADLSIASRLGQEGIGFYIVNNDVTDVYVVAEPVRGEDLVPLDPAGLADLIGPDGVLSQLINYEVRESQMDMLKEVAGAFNQDRIIAAEAGTGVGKSFAYLIPAMAWAARNKERVVVSTATINLQQQLMDKDIPLVRKILGDKIKAVLVKGRGNYLCRRRLAEALEADSLFRDEDNQLESISAWAAESPTGGKTELPFLPDEEVWNSVCSEADGCMGLRCPARETCFVIKARKEAASAQLLVVNHHLLFSDLSLRVSGAGFQNTAVLPPFNRIIFDEAHNMEKSATSFFSRELNRFGVNRLLFRLYHRRKGADRGVWPALAKYRPGGQEHSRELPALIQEIGEQLASLEKAAGEFMAGDTSYRFRNAGGSNDSRGSNGNDSRGRRDPGDSAVLGANFLVPLGVLQNSLLKVQELLHKALEGVDEEFREEGIVWEARMILNRLLGYSAVCEAFRVWTERPEDIFWFEKTRTRRGEEYVRFMITPLKISDIMRDAVFEPYDTVVCTSATLSVKDSFEYWADHTGLSDINAKEVKTFRFPSPFPYRENVLLGVPTDAPDPSSPDFSAFLTEMVFDTLSLSEGHGLVLFTSYSQLRETYEQTASRFQELGIPVLRQGDDHRAKLLEDFNARSASVLFATSSFWEGVDTPGDSLQVVIICRLPFSVPSDPVLSARREELEKRGGNAFFQLSLPEAVMRLKQGFGRLMRASTDRGVVLILDPRIIRKAYGSLFLESLPETRRTIKDRRSLLADVEAFLFP